VAVIRCTLLAIAASVGCVVLYVLSVPSKCVTETVYLDIDRFLDQRSLRS